MFEQYPHAQPSRRLKLAGLAGLGLALMVAATGIWMRVGHAHALQKEVESQHVTVQVVRPQFGPTDEELVLPGDVRADVDAPIYARVNGYLRVWHTDIGTRVKKGQVLGEIETPELDQQISQAEADVARAQSNYEIAEVTAKRWQNLLSTDSVSHQEADEKTADAKAKSDALGAARANLKNLLALQAFNRIVAPFDGVVTERNTDVGKLITSGSNSSQPLFRVVDMRKLRVYVEVPQNYSYMIKPGMKVQIDLPERPGQHFPATVVNTSDAIHEASRTSTVELHMDNQDGKLLPGSYAEVHFDLSAPSNTYRVPASALLFRKEGLQVATVGADNRVVLKHITIARDLGRAVEVGTGIDAADRVIDSPSDSIAQGDVVRVKEAATQTNGQGSGDKS